MVLTRNQFEKSGAWLFQHRSFLGLAGFPLLIAGLKSFSYIHHSHQITEEWQLLCFFVSLSGLALRIFTIGFVPKRTSGRNTHRQVAETLNTTGIYSLVRNPLYLGNYLIMLGFAMFFHLLWLVIIASFICALGYHAIVCAEEAFLRKSFGKQFDDWSSRTPAFIPRLSGWVPPKLHFCWRTVCRREYTAFFLITAGFFFLDVAADSITEGTVRVRGEWTIIFVVGALTYLTLRTLKKKTRLLRVQGR